MKKGIKGSVPFAENGTDRFGGYPACYQPAERGPPLNGPTISSVTQPP